jgi:two-component system NtrC family sensor kinase
VAATREPVVLLVDDDPRVLSALRRGLRREGFRIETAADGREALEKLEHAPVALVISDHKMPGMTGIELLQTVRRRWPETRRILMSGWTGEIPPAELDAADLYSVMGKPWDDAELRATARVAAGVDA